MSTTLRRRAPSRHSLSVLPKKSRGMGYASTAFALGTSTLTCMLVAESRDGWIASRTRSPWEEAVNLKRLRGRSYGWQASRLPSSPARSSMSLAASEQQGARRAPRRTVLKHLRSGALDTRLAFASSLGAHQPHRRLRLAT